jgi:Carbohydrate binding domain
MKRIVLFLAMMGGAAVATAQNLIQNPGFDEDASGWDLSMFSTWSNRVDHGDSPFSGALQITTRTTDTGAQCVNLRGATTYTVSVWAEKDPQPSIAPCATPGSTVGLNYFDAQQCAGPTNLEFIFAERIPEPDGWQHFSGSFKTPETTQSALLMLSGSCRSAGAGIAIHYFDDISLEPDIILQADFEPQSN